MTAIKQYIIKLKERNIMEMIRRKMNKKGFTLIELIVVIAILAVIAAIAIPIFTGMLGNAKQKAADADAKTIATQAQVYLTDAELKGAAESTFLDSGKATMLATVVSNDIVAKCTGLTAGSTVTITVKAASGDGAYQLSSVSVVVNGKTGTFPKAAE